MIFLEAVMDNKKNKSYKEVTERFCPNVGDNVVLIRTVDSTGETYSCTSQAKCKNDNCEHTKK